MFLDGFRVPDFLGKKGQVLCHGAQVLHLLGLCLGVLVHIVLGEFLLKLPLFVVHEGVELPDIEGALGEVDIFVEFIAYHYYWTVKL